MATHISVAAITYDTAARAIALAIEEGAKVGVRVSATVVDPGGALVAYGRDDGTTPHSEETSRRKANTGASNQGVATVSLYTQSALTRIHRIGNTP